MNGVPDWHGTKGMWVAKMLDTQWPHPWPWPLIFKVNSGMGCLIDMERKGYESTECWTCVVTFNFVLWPHRWPWPWIFTIEFWNSCIPGMGVGLIDLEREGYESIGCYTDFVTFSYDLDLGFWKCCISGMGGPIDMEPKWCESIGC